MISQRITPVRGKGLSTLLRAKQAGRGGRQFTPAQEISMSRDAAATAAYQAAHPPSPKPVKGLGYAPFDPNARPPAGSYDPAIDANASAAQRGVDYAQQDYARNTGRLNADYAISTQNLGQRYDFLASGQNQRARAMGVDQGGWAQASQQARETNKSKEQDSLRLTWERAMADALQANTRAGLENTAYQEAAQNSRVFQANQSTPGWANIDKFTAHGYRVDNVDRTDANGPYRLARHLKTGKLVKIRPNGGIEGR